MQNKIKNKEAVGSSSTTENRNINNTSVAPVQLEFKFVEPEQLTGVGVSKPTRRTTTTEGTETSATQEPVGETRFMKEKPNQMAIGSSSTTETEKKSPAAPDTPGVGCPVKSPTAGRRRRGISERVLEAWKRRIPALKEKQVRLNETEWHRRGFRLKENAKGRPYEYVCPSHYTHIGWRFGAHEVEPRYCRRGFSARRLQFAMIFGEGNAQ